jgi:hypothetical protein
MPSHDCAAALIYWFKKGQYDSRHKLHFEPCNVHDDDTRICTCIRAAHMHNHTNSTNVHVFQRGAVHIINIQTYLHIKRVFQCAVQYIRTVVYTYIIHTVHMCSSLRSSQVGAIQPLYLYSAMSDISLRTLSCGRRASAPTSQES